MSRFKPEPDEWHFVVQAGPSGTSVVEYGPVSDMTVQMISGPTPLFPHSWTSLTLTKNLFVRRNDDGEVQAFIRPELIDAS